MFEAREKVEHTLSKEWLVVLEVKKDSVVCRTKDCRTVELFNWEVRKVR